MVLLKPGPFLLVHSPQLCFVVYQLACPIEVSSHGYAGFQVYFLAAGGTQHKPDQGEFQRGVLKLVPGSTATCICATGAGSFIRAQHFRTQAFPGTRCARTARKQHLKLL